jgi:hypothetical protein
MQFVSSVSRPKNPSSVSIWVSSTFVRGRYTSRTFEGLSEEAALEGLSEEEAFSGLSEGGAFVLEEASGGLLEEAAVATGLSCSGRKRSCADSTLKSRKGMLTDAIGVFFSNRGWGRVDTLGDLFNIGPGPFEIPPVDRAIKVVSRSYQRPWCNFQHVANAVCACWKVLTLCLSRLCWTPWQMYPASKPGAHKLYPPPPPLLYPYSARDLISPQNTTIAFTDHHNTPGHCVTIQATYYSKR